MYFILMKVFVVVCILISVAFVTLMERKVLGYIQYRKGPNKLGFVGILQPISDAIKLFSKEKMNFYFMNSVYFYLTPMVSLVLMLMFWLIMSLDKWGIGAGIEFEFLLIMIISSMGVYIIMLSGWASNSKYALLGAYRGVAQVISYEVNFSFLILSVFLFSGSLKMWELKNFQVESLSLIFGLAVSFFCWLVILLAETNRTPFDLSEGESELVSGFNVEYGGVSFAILFMAEYGNILFMSWVSSYLFFSGESVLFMAVVLIILMIRGTFIRYRYDKLMMLSWKSILPFVIMNYMLVVILLV